MTVRRLGLTAAAMAAVALVLRALTGPWHESLATLAEAATFSETSRPEQVVLAAAGLLAWAVWAWGALGLLLTAAAALPGVCGLLARGVSRLVLPASLRSAVGLALGVGIVVTAPAAAAAPTTGAAAVAVPDWPIAAEATEEPRPPDWPSGAPPDETVHVVVAGDCLWRIAEDRLLAGGHDPTNADVARAVDRWWSTNASVVGPDPDLIRPGQVLRAPADPAPPTYHLRPGSTR